ncbi:unnamed protein product [Polarella glacialis]|uniref:Uncharacterized protein n=1 Tax=Polarella glacialis TaxID=89957 RepID=A0A813HI36_POLGL|nr:unnamed protein product [Polarella glacialis]
MELAALRAALEAGQSLDVEVDKLRAAVGSIEADVRVLRALKGANEKLQALSEAEFILEDPKRRKRILCSAVLATAAIHQAIERQKDRDDPTKPRVVPLEPFAHQYAEEAAAAGRPYRGRQETAKWRTESQVAWVPCPPERVARPVAPPPSSILISHACVAASLLQVLPVRHAGLVSVEDRVLMERRLGHVRSAAGLRREARACKRPLQSSESGLAPSQLSGCGGTRSVSVLSGISLGSDGGSRLRAGAMAPPSAAALLLSRLQAAGVAPWQITALRDSEARLVELARVGRFLKPLLPGLGAKSAKAAAAGADAGVQMTPMSTSPKSTQAGMQRLIMRNTIAQLEAAGETHYSAKLRASEQRLELLKLGPAVSRYGRFL